MNIVISVYDFFSYFIPGIFYLFIINEFLRISGAAFIDINQITNFPQAITLGVLAFVFGHLFDKFCHKYWYRGNLSKIALYPWYRKFTYIKAELRAIEEIQKRYPQLNLNFNESDCQILYAILRFLKPEISVQFSSMKAQCIMLRNVSFAFFLFSLSSLFEDLVGQFIVFNIMLALFALYVSKIALDKSRTFDKWFYLVIFEQSIPLGNSLDEIMTVFKKDSLQISNAK